MIVDNMLLGILLVAILYTHYNLFIVKKQLDIIQKRLEELRNQT